MADYTTTKPPGRIDGIDPLDWYVTDEELEAAGDDPPAGEDEAGEVAPVDFGITGPVDLAALAIGANPPAPARPGANALTSLDALQQTTSYASAWMAALAAWMAANLQPGRDYGRIKGEGRNGQPFTGKPTLLKPGAERITIALGLRARFVMDKPTYQMAGSPAGLIAYKCLLVDSNGEVCGEGRGAASQQEKGSINNAIKFAEKRAQTDAVLRLAALSAFFVTEDDMEAETRRETNQPPQQAAGQRTRAANARQNSNAGNRPPGASNRRPQNPDRAATLAVFRQRHPLATNEELGGLIAEWMQARIRRDASPDNITPADWARAREIMEAGRQPAPQGATTNPAGQPAPAPRRRPQDLAAEIFA